MLIGLLEDDLAIREMIQLILQNEGHRVITYATSEACLTHLRANDSSGPSCDLLVVDMRLANSISGLTVIEYIRADPHLEHLPIILTTAATALDKQELDRLRVTLLPKPFDIDDILQLVTEMTSDATH